jgi:SAM-dependent methyltransferase
MLETARRRIAQELPADIAKRISLVSGYLNDQPAASTPLPPWGSTTVPAPVEMSGFDSATSVLVCHFCPDDESPAGKRAYLQAIASRLKPGAPFVLVDGCGDVNSKELDTLLDVWGQYLLQKGAAPDFPAQMKKTMKTVVQLVPEQRLITLLQQTGFTDVQRVYTGFHFVGFRARYAGPSAAGSAAAAPAK